MGSVVAVLVVFFGGIWLLVKYLFSIRAKVDRHYPWEHNNQLTEDGKVVPKPAPTKEPTEFSKFCDKYGTKILVGTFFAAMIIGPNTHSIVVGIICLLIMVAALIFILVGYIHDAGNKLIEKSVEASSPTREQMDDICKRYNLQRNSYFQIMQHWKEEEYNRRKMD